MKRLLVMVALISILLPTAALASDVSGAAYRGTITITNNSTAASGVVVPVSINATALISQDMLSSDISDAAVRSGSTDIASGPQYGSNNWWLWVPSVGESQTTSNTFYTTNVTGGKIRYFPGTAGMAVSDDATLELGDAWALTWSGYLVSSGGTDHNLGLKTGAIRVENTASGNITAGICAGYPTVEATAATEEGAGDTSHPITMPADIAGGDLLLVNVSLPSSGGWTDPTGWTRLVNDTNGLSIIFYKVAAGGDTMTIETTNSIRAAALAYRISGYSGIPMAGTVADGSSSAPDPPSLTVADNMTTLWFAFEGNSGGANGHVDTYPADYGDGLDANTTGANAGGAVLEYNGVTQDPGAYALNDGAVSWAANTVAVYSGYSTQLSTTGVSSGEKTTFTVSANTGYMGFGIDQGDARVPMGDNVTLGMPFFDSSLSGASFTSIDPNELTVTATGTTQSTSDGRTFVSASGDKLTIADDPAIELTEFTLEGWINPASVAQNRTIAAKQTGGGAGAGYTIRFWNSGQVRLDILNGAGGNTNAEFIGMGLTASEWTHIAIAYKNQVAYFWKNGVGDSKACAITLVDSGGALYIGGNYAGTAAYDGSMGELRLYNRLLTDAEVLANYNATKDHYNGNDQYLTYNYVGDTTVIDNANDWTFVENSVMPYVQSIEVEVGGAQAGYWEPTYAATFPDQSGNSNDATPTWPTSSSDPDVSATLASFGPISPAAVSSYSLSLTGDILDSDPTAPSELYTEGDFTHLLGADFINALLDTGGTPRMLWWLPFIFIGLAILFLLLAGPARSVLLPSIVVEGALAALGIMGPIPLLAAFIWPIWVAGWVVNEKHQTVGS